MQHARRPTRATLVCILFVSLAAATPARVSLAEPPTVVVLSWDGVRHDYPARGKVPGLERLAREGARARRLTPVYPSDTFPNHVSLATGTHPDRHGILGNTFHDRSRGLEEFSYENDASWLRAEPLWVSAERQGVRAATYFWVGSETEWQGVGATHRMAPFDSSVEEDAKVDQIFAWLDLPPETRPRLVMSWWHGADRPGHRKGPDHPDVVAALEAQDLQLERLLAGLDARDAWPHTTLLVVSDHGMTAASEIVDFESPLDAAGIAPLVSRSAGSAQLYFEDATQIEPAARLLKEIEGVAVLRRDEVPKRLRMCPPDRCGDLVLTTEPPRALVEPSVARRLQTALGSLAGLQMGTHGYDPRHPDMGAIFFAMGRGVPSGVVFDEVATIDVAATISALLGIEPPRDSEGRAVFGSTAD